MANEQKITNTTKELSTRHPRNRLADEHSLAWIQWDWFWNQLQPRSVFGKEVKQKLVPFARGEEVAWLREIEQSQKIGLVAPHVNQLHLSEVLEVIPDPRPLCALLAKGETGHQADWFTMKRFIWYALPILEVIKQVDEGQQQSITLLQYLLSLLGQEEQSLSLEEINPALSKMKKEYLLLQAELRAQRVKSRKQAEQDLEPFHIGIQQDRQVYLPLQDVEGIKACRKHPAFREVRQTPYEIIFQLIAGPEEDQLDKKSQLLEAEIEQEEQVTLALLAKQFRLHLDALDQIIHDIGQWDWRWAKWQWKQMADMIWPTLDAEHIVMQAGRFLPLEQKVIAEGRCYTPVSVDLSYGCTVLTGMNMGGKSVTLKTIASLTLLAHYALPVPASAFQTPLLKCIKIISGDQQSVLNELSTFGAEMHDLVQHWTATDQLLLFDELARGTNPAEGEALVFAIADQLAHRKENITVMVTHYTFSQELADTSFYQIGNVDEEGQIQYEVRRVEQGRVPNQALFISRKMGVPQAIIDQAYHYLTRKQQSDKDRNRGE